jgi:hypothetical protein
LGDNVLGAEAAAARGAGWRERWVGRGCVGIGAFVRVRVGMRMRMGIGTAAIVAVKEPPVVTLEATYMPAAQARNQHAFHCFTADHAGQLCRERLARLAVRASLGWFVASSFGRGVGNDWARCEDGYL